MSEEKKQIESLLLGFAIGAVIFTFAMAYLIAVTCNDYENKIKLTEQKCK